MTSVCQDSARTTYEYDAGGRLLTTTLHSGVEATHTYDDADRLVGLTHSRFGWVLGTYTYTVDAAGNRTGVVERLLPLATTAIIYTYDSVNRRGL